MSNETLSNSAIDYSKEVQTHLTHEKLFRQYLASHKDFTNYLKFRDALPRDEHLGHRFADEIYGYIAGRKGRFLRDENGAFHVLIDGKRVPLICSHENHALADLVLKACNITMVSAVSRVAIQRISNVAWRSSSRMTFRRFSAMYDGPEPRIYIPTTTEGNILCIDSTGCNLVSNGDNADGVWLEHPMDDPLGWSHSPSKEAVLAALRLFEDLLVNTQACAVPAMRWFVAMHEGLFPYVRDTIMNRFIVVHRGRSGSGKTSGAQRFTILHGLGDVLGDASVAALGNMPEQGLVVLDNKEQANFTQPLIDYCLFLATGAARLRSSQDGDVRRSPARGVGVITSIEGVVRQELRERCVNVEYTVPGEFIGRGEIESAIRREGHGIRAALAVVLQEYLAVRVDPEVHIGINPIPRFEEHFIELARLLIAYGRVTGRMTTWADEILEEWNTTLRDHTSDDEDALEEPIIQALSGGTAGAVKHEAFVWGDRTATLWVTETGSLLSALQKHGIESVGSMDAGGFGRRLRTIKFRRFDVLDERSSPKIDELQHTKSKRFIGFFVP
jgi:hypothetical protein